jgi:hypothetical protein
MSEFKKNAVAIAIGLVFSVILLIAIDEVFRAAKLLGYGYKEQRLIEMVDVQTSVFKKRFEVPTKWRERPITNSSYVRPDRNLKGFFKEYLKMGSGKPINWAPAPLPGRSYWIKETDLDTGQVAYDIEYKIDDFGYRIVPRTTEERASRFALFLGCSFTYGEGLKETETMPYFFSDLDPTYRSYNMAYHGYGPNDLLARARGDTNLQKMIEQPSGVILYTFIDDHVQRALGSSSHFVTTMGNHPYFTENEDGRLTQHKDFDHGEPFFALFSNLLGSSATGNFFHLDFPPRLSEKHFRFFAEIVSELREEYSRQFPKSHFYFIFYPGSHLAGTVIPFLEEKKIHYLDYSNLQFHKYSKLSMQIKDGHPAVEANRLLSQIIYDDVQSFENSDGAKAF